MHDYTHMVNYRGFVYTKDESARASPPGLSQVRQAAELLSKPKKARNVHPLFARGFDTKLVMRVREEGLRVYVNGGKEALVVMDLSMHKMAYVIAQDRDVYFVARHDLRGKGVMYKVHGFKVANTSEAKKLASEISMTVNSVFKKLRKTRDFVKKQRGSSSPKASTNASSEGKGDGVRMRHAGAGQNDDESAHLKKFIAETRKSILAGGVKQPITASDLDIVEKTLSMADDELKKSGIEELRRELHAALSSAVSSDDAAACLPNTADDTRIIYDDSYTDEFARMTMFVHSGVYDEVPTYAEITLDSDLFDYSSVSEV